jgi:vancomycin resistance protein YoaR
LPVLRRPAALVAASAVTVLVLALVALWMAQAGRALPNTSVAGVDVGGLTADEIAERLTPTVRERETDAVVFTFEDERFELQPADVGYRIDVDASVAAALARGRSNPLSDVPVRVASFWQDHDVALVEDTDRTELEDAVDEIADEVDRDRFSGAVVADPETLEVSLERPQGAAEVVRDEAVDALEAALRSPGPEELPLPATVEDPPVTPDAARAVADQVERAIAEPLELRVDDTSLTLDRSQLAALLEVGETEDGTDLELRVTEAAVEEQIGGAAADRFDISPVDATFETSRTPPTSFDDNSSTTWSPVEISPAAVVPGRDGRTFVPETAAEQLTEALREAERTVELEVEITPPALTTAEAEEQRPTHLLSTFTTAYTAGQTRVANIQRLADVVDGAQVLPGDDFSINRISGERSCSKGYEPAGTIVRGELVDTCGGGVSQFGTTTFNAAFFSGLQLDQWQAHSFYISRYPMGREATLSYPALDVVFTNTSDAPVVVRASYTSTTITVSIYGRPIASSVSATHGQPFDRRSPTTETRTTSELPAGRTRTVQSSGSDGFKVQVTRRVDLLAGGTDERSFTTTYQPQNGIVERGTG